MQDVTPVREQNQAVVGPITEEDCCLTGSTARQSPADLAANARIVFDSVFPAVSDTRSVRLGNGGRFFRS